MDPLRIILFSGLGIHKLLWEFLKKRDRTRKLSFPSSSITKKKFVKAVKALALAFFGYQTLFLDLFSIAEESSTLRILGGALYFVGFVTAVLGRLQLGKNWVDLEDYQVLPEQSLTTRGIYRYVRHPIYTGDILLLIGLELALNSWLVLAVIVPLMIAVRQALTEEALLSKVFPTYPTYCRRTRRFIPFIV